jgi:2,3-bisphosphoglycerate-independent phosphoglycerate mutase
VVLLVFIDGLGAGIDDPAFNPLSRTRGLLSHFADGTSAVGRLPAGGRVQLIDACLGVEGRPQSATGQATLLTGRNAAAHLGRHLVGFPNHPLRDLLGADNLFMRLRRAGRRVGFLNAYHRPYLSALGLPFDPPRRIHEPDVAIPRRLARPAATTVAACAAQMTFRTFDDVLEGRALYHDIRNELPRSRGLGDVPPLDPDEAGRRLVAMARAHDFSLFEHFLADKAGHDRDAAAATSVLEDLERFLASALGALDARRETLVVVSDHGNVEDLSRRTHTRHPVPLLGFGAGDGAVGGVGDLTGVAPTLEALTDLHSP